MASMDLFLNFLFFLVERVSVGDPGVPGPGVGGPGHSPPPDTPPWRRKRRRDGRVWAWAAERAYFAADTWPVGLRETDGK